MWVLKLVLKWVLCPTSQCIIWNINLLDSSDSDHMRGIFVKVGAKTADLWLVKLFAKSSRSIGPNLVFWVQILRWKHKLFGFILKSLVKLSSCWWKMELRFRTYRPFQETFNTRVAKCMHKYCEACDGVQCLFSFF